MNATQVKQDLPARVLIVEDEALIAEELKGRLQGLNYRVLGHVDTGDKAICCALEMCPDLILMDIRLKGAMDGILAAESIRESIDVPIVYLTAHSDLETLRRAKASSPFGYILKPFQERELFVAIEMALQRHQVERALRASESRYATTLASIGDGVIATDLAGHVTFMNPVAESLTGWPLAEAKGLTIGEILLLVREKDRERYPDPIQHVLRQVSVVHCNDRVLLVDRDGTEIPFEDCAAPILDEKGRPSGAVLAFRDASAARRAESELKQAQHRLQIADKLETIGRLSASIAHDFNNLITIIRGSSDLLLLDSDCTAAIAEYSHEIQAACNRATTLTKRMLAYSRQQILEPFITDINVIVLGLAKFIERMLGPQSTLNLQLNSRPCLALIDPGQIEQVLLNLTANARDAMPNGGTLTIETRLRELSLSEISAARLTDLVPGTYVELIVRDTGVGMDPLVQAQAFEPFFTTKTGAGTGLGLASAKGFVLQSKGEIRVSSTLGVGTEFSIYLPAQRKPAEPSVAQPSQELFPGNGETILLIEHDEAVRAVTRQALQIQSYHVLEALDTQRALALVQQHTQSLALLITEMALPGANALQLVRQLRNLKPDLPVLLLSSSNEALLGAHSQDLQHTAYLRKPYTLRELGTAVRKCLDKFRSPA